MVCGESLREWSGWWSRVRVKCRDFYQEDLGSRSPWRAEQVGEGVTLIPITKRSWTYRESVFGRARSPGDRPYRGVYKSRKTLRDWYYICAATTSIMDTAINATMRYSHEHGTRLDLCFGSPTHTGAYRSLRNGEAGCPSRLYKLQSGKLAQPYLTDTGSGTSGLHTST